jgi:heme-degrading monooxygenase HmoA
MPSFVSCRVPYIAFISYSEWESEAAIEAYRNSQAHQEIVRHARALKGAKAEVKLYDVVQ